MVDFSTLFTQLLTTYWWTIPLLIFVALFESAWFKGFIGEVMVNMAAQLFLDKNNYRLIKNVTTPAEGGARRKREAVLNCAIMETFKMKQIDFGVR